jgi:hypothetical protein
MGKRTIINKEQLINEPRRLKPHVVILGAGASKQAFENGDANGNKIPLMNDLIEIVGLDELLLNNGIEYNGKDFEKIYSELYEKDKYSKIIKEIENIVYNYFDKLKLPNRPTLYDHLLMSLRPKDFVATFNWDPFLFDAYERNIENIPLPQIIHLHGNVRIGYCSKHNIYGKNGTFCPDCDKKLTPYNLFYPIPKKNYNDFFNLNEWNILNYALSKAFSVTIFGFNASDTDREAYNRLRNAWKKYSERKLEHIEIIDKKDRNILSKHWHSFMPTYHLLYKKDFYKSWIPNHPRRSCESLFYPKIEGKFVEEYQIPKELDFDDLYQWFEPIIKAENILSKLSQNN